MAVQKKDDRKEAPSKGATTAQAAAPAPAASLDANNAGFRGAICPEATPDSSCAAPPSEAGGGRKRKMAVDRASSERRLIAALPAKPL